MTEKQIKALERLVERETEDLEQILLIMKMSGDIDDIQFNQLKTMAELIERKKESFEQMILVRKILNNKIFCDIK